MLAIILTILVTFFTCSLFGYIAHWSLHQHWAGRLNRLHMTHHQTLYPPKDYLSRVYRDAGKDNTTKVFAMLSVPLVVLPVILGIFGILPLALVLIAILVMAAMGFLHDYLHDAFHIEGHVLTKIKGVKAVFGYWNHLHYLHHVDMQKNFGIFLFHWDHIFRTFWQDHGQVYKGNSG